MTFGCIQLTSTHKYTHTYINAYKIMLFKSVALAICYISSNISSMGMDLDVVPNINIYNLFIYANGAKFDVRGWQTTQIEIGCFVSV